MKQPQSKHTVGKRPIFRLNLNFLPSNVMLVFISVTTHDRVTAAVAVIGFPLQAKKGKKKKQKTKNTQTEDKREKNDFCVGWKDLLRSGAEFPLRRDEISEPLLLLCPPGVVSTWKPIKWRHRRRGCPQSVGLCELHRPEPGRPCCEPQRRIESAEISGVSALLPERVGTPMRVGDLPQFPFFLSPETQ